MANGLGAINHTLLTLKAIKQAGLTLLGVIANELKPICKLNKTDLEIAKDNNQILAYRLKDYQVEGLNPVFLNLQYLDLKDLNSLDQALKALDPLVDLITNPRPKTDLVAKDRQILWHPYTKANQTGPLEAVKTSYANRIVLTDGRELIDGMSSWWCAIHGYKHPKLVEALQTQAAKLSHIMFGGLTHEPAVTLASRLLKHLPKNLSKIFWADSGSVAVEVALKMAWQYQVAQGKTKKKHFLTLRGGYHGDTLGAMSVCDPINGMHHLFKGFLPPQFFTERPSCPFSKPFDPQSLKDITSQLEEHQEEIAAIILEPIVQGAGGMWFYHPLYLKEVAKLAKEADCLLIFDEIATGFGHTGKFFAADWAELRPDILCLGKALTGGMLTLAATACTEEVAQGISSRGHPFMHGPTFMANPLALSVALAGLDLMEENLWQGEVAAIEATLKQELAVCQSLSIVKEVRVLGDIGVVETFEAVDQDFLMAYFTDLGVWIRPFNNLVYIMPPYISPLKDIKTLCQAIYLGLKALENRK
ncbi:MAG: adenosylmethionine--8-amino-7-oxononanoate transaminase [Desulfovibrionaceae bacterium]|nr:adenosylmethionine--8-amino-7-oxononanoate transaminase [Desulfovibrionaceae bacterium]